MPICFEGRRWQEAVNGAHGINSYEKRKEKSTCTFSRECGQWEGVFKVLGAHLQGGGRVVTNKPIMQKVIRVDRKKEKKKKRLCRA
jgi:hypothetical protein